MDLVLFGLVDQPLNYFNRTGDKKTPLPESYSKLV